MLYHPLEEAKSKAKTSVVKPYKAPRAEAVRLLHLCVMLPWGFNFNMNYRENRSGQLSMGKHENNEPSVRNRERKHMWAHMLKLMKNRKIIIEHLMRTVLK